MYAAGDVRVEDAREPTIRAPTDAIVRILRSCICGSDLHGYYHVPATGQGRPMGHEMIAVVEETGSAVRAVRAGDFVVVPFMSSDNACAFCREGLRTSCVNVGFSGEIGASGLQAELARIPHTDGSVVTARGSASDTT